MAKNGIPAVPGRCPAGATRGRCTLQAAAADADVDVDGWMWVSPIDAKTSGLKRPSKVLKKFLRCVVRMAKKPLGVVRDIKEAMAFPSNIFCLA
jgi:hypothetical protein